jgi:hypothetical protein
MARDQGIRGEDPWLTGTYWFECGINDKYANRCEVLGVIKLLTELEFLNICVYAYSSRHQKVKLHVFLTSL